MERLSPAFCMSELHYVYQHALYVEQESADRLVPLLLDDAKIAEQSDRIPRAKHWEDDYRKDRKNLRHLGQNDMDLWHRKVRWHDAVGDMLSAIANMLTVRGAAAIRADDFRVARDMLERPRRGR